ncbi:MAG: LysM peptidoglycan-binding domain-containing protein [Planctomycetaceae bacterium]
MHRDTKIGLALAILLIGFAGALCFPRHSAVDVAMLELEGADELDAAIELLPVRAYTERRLDKLVDAIDLTAPQPLTPPPFSPSDLSPHGGVTPQPSAPPPNPIPAIGANRTTATGLSMAGLEQGAKTDSSQTNGVSKNADAVPEETIHTVQAGETLSGLASRYLGSASRFPEIYEANRDVLEHPDALRLNMKLRIPSRQDDSSQLADQPAKSARR